ncbi:MAG: site-specific integrase [Thermoanaerobacter sp.]|nr:site-specific integrase [Thermoanaerobacter sp.]
MAGKRGHGEGTIYKRKDGRWEAKASIGFDPATGKPRRLTKYFKTRKEAQEWLAKVQHEKATGTFVEPHRVTVGEWLDRWLNDYVKPRVRPKTWQGYKDVARLHIIPEIGHIPLSKLQAGDLQRLYNSKMEGGRADGKEGGLSSRTIHMMHQVIHGALKQATKEQLIPRNVSEAVSLPKLRYKEIQPLTAEQVARFLEAAKSDRLYTAFLMDIGTGLRRGELLALRWQDVDLKNGVVHVKQSIGRVKVENGPTKTALVFSEPKTPKSRRTVPLPGEVLRELKEHKKRQAQEKLFFGQAYQDNGLVFCTEDGRPLDPDNFGKRYGRLLKKAGIPHVALHNLRHTCATLLLEAGEHPKIVQELLGHSRINITLDIYSHVRPEMLQQAAAKLDGFLKAKEKPSSEGIR